MDAPCARLLSSSSWNTIRCTRVTISLELKRIANAVMDAGIAHEAVTIRSHDHRDAVEARKNERTPVSTR